MVDVALATCPHCGAPREASIDCPKCGVIYAKAHELRAPRAAPQLPEPPASTGTWEGDVEDARLEQRLKLFAVPAGLVFAHFVVATSIGHSLARVFLSMFVHELGHAVAAWLCGFMAFPALWVTPMSLGRIPAFAVALSLALGLGSFCLWRVGRRRGAATLGTMLVLQLALTLGLSARSAQALIAFAGDAGCFVLGAALMCTAVSNGHRITWGFHVAISSGRS